MCGGGQRIGEVGIESALGASVRRGGHGARGTQGPWHL